MFFGKSCEKTSLKKIVINTGIKKQTPVNCTKKQFSATKLTHPSDYWEI